MARRLNSTDWMSLAEAARDEQDPKRFMVLIKMLYDVLNTRENEMNVEGEGTDRAELPSAA
jgi:hypothetical protein